MSEVKFHIRENIDPKDYFKETKHIISYAFSVGDRHYFRFDDIFNMPYDRGLKCLVYFRELDMNCDSKLLQAHTEAFDNILSAQQFNVNDMIKLKQLNDQLKQRLQLPKEPDLMYKMASIVFFDQHENPYVYEFKYGEKKIHSWKKHATLAGFFLQKPLKELIPYLNFAGENLEQFSQMTEKATKQHSDFLSPLLSAEQRMILLGK